MSGKSKDPGLAAGGAWALIEAASLEADAVTQKQLVGNIESLKTSFDSILNKVAQKMDSSNKYFDAKINTLNQQLDDVKSHLVLVNNKVGTLKSLMEEDCKRKTLESARALTKLGTFEYYDRSTRKDSSDLAREVLDWFLLGYG
eukprot:scaffold15231_cov66-Cyclotella_meneghiniana.AAC.11